MVPTRDPPYFNANLLVIVKEIKGRETWEPLHLAFAPNMQKMRCPKSKLSGFSASPAPIIVPGEDNEPKKTALVVHTKHQIKQEDILGSTTMESNLALATKVVVTEQDTANNETKPQWQELLELHDVPSPTKNVPEDTDDEPGEIRSAAPHEEEVKEEVEVATDGVASTNAIGSPEKPDTGDLSQDGSNSPMDTTGEDGSPLDEIQPSLSNLGSYQKITLIEDRLNEAVAKVEPNVQNRSPDIIPLSKTYNDLRKKLRLLVAASKKYHEASLAEDKARTEWMKQISILSEDSPLYNYIGRTEPGAEVSAADEGTELEHRDPSISVMVMQKLGSAQVRASAQEFKDTILDYATEWETIVTKRIDRDLVEVKQLQRDRLHYENKVAALRRKVNTIETKGKTVPDATVEKLERNDKKLDIAHRGHEIKAAQLCVLIEEATNSGWKDLYPLVESVLRWDETRLSRESMAYEGIPTTLQRISNTAQRLISATGELVMAKVE